VRHIFERLIRKFGYADVVKQAEGVEGDGVKFLENIRKRKERSKRKKAAKDQDGAAGGAMEDEDDDVSSSSSLSPFFSLPFLLLFSTTRSFVADRLPSRLPSSSIFQGPSKPRTSTGNAFEDALYGSESEIDDSDDDMGAQKGDHKGPKGKGKDARPATFIREDGDEPMDLLDRTLAGRVGSESFLPSLDFVSFRSENSH